MAAVSLTFTFLPNGIASAGVVRGSILVSPTVAVEPADGTVWIRDVALLASWPATIKSLALLVECGPLGQPNGQALPVTVAPRVESLVYPQGRSMWKDVVHDTFVGTPPPARSEPVKGLGEQAAFKAQVRRLTTAARGTEVLSVTEVARSEEEEVMREALRDIYVEQRTPISILDASARDAAEDPREFHRRVAALFVHRAPAREVGLVVDVTFPDPGGDWSWIRVVKPASLTASATIVCPRTRVERRVGGQAAFVAARAEASAVPLADSLPLEGFGSITPSRLIHLHAETTDVSELDPVALSERVGARALPITTDQVLVMSEIVPKVLEKASKRASALREARDNAELFAEDLARGMAIDVAIDSPTPAWRNLCGTAGTHHTVVANHAGPDLAEPAGSSPVEFGELVGNTARRASEVAFRLDGWSLVCPRPGASADEERGEIVDESPLRSKLSPPPRSLSKLRYGTNYRCRARALDLVGNDMSAGLIVAASDQETLRFDFRRLEPVQPPQILGTELYKPSGDRPDPQAARRIAVGYTYAGVQHTAELRYLLPPKGSAAAIEFSGSLDRENDVDAYNLLKRLDEKPPSTFDSHARVPYLPDPFAAGVRFEGLPGQRAVVQRPFAPDWPNPEGFPFIVKPARTSHAPKENREELVSRILANPAGAASVPPPLGDDQEPHEELGYLTVRVRPGFRHVAAVRSWMAARKDQHRVYDRGEKRLVRLSPAELDAEPAATLLRDLATPGATIEIVHPVVSPLLEPRLLEHEPPLTVRDGRIWAPRKLDAKDADLAFEALVHEPTSGELELVGKWAEPVEVGTPAPFETATIARLEVVDLAGISQPEVLTKLGLKRFHLTTRHHFKDGKHRDVEYHLRATTSFGAYYTDTEVRAGAVAGPELSVRLPATQPPEPPKILRIVPTFRLVPLPQAADRPTHARLCGLRIYLGRPWYSSGAGEQLAVVEYCRHPATPEAEKALASASQWANDPTREERAQGATTGLIFRHMRAAAEPYPDEMAQKEAVDPFELERGPERGLKVRINAFEPQMTHGELTCDVDVGVRTPADSQGPYFPFVRLALARYQPYSVGGAALSDIVHATFVQLPPNRTLVVLEKDGRIEATVQGAGVKNRMRFHLVKRGRQEIVTTPPMGNASIETTDLNLLVPVPTDAVWVDGDGEGTWTHSMALPHGNHSLIVIEEELRGTTRFEYPLCCIDIG